MRPPHAALALGLVTLAAIALGHADDAPAPPAPAPPPGPPPTAAQIEASKRAFADVARVLQSPRCRNCHPAGDAPLQGDAGRRHAMFISRASIAAGLPCQTCHQPRNSEAIGVVGGPPGAPHWGLPPRDQPMVFEGKTASALCLQLRDPAGNGQRTLAELLVHVSHDPLVLWGWSPGGKRSRPPLPHDRFVAAFATWVAGGGACP